MIALPHFRPAFFGVGMDADAAAYIAAVEAADGQSLETATKQAIANFVEGCKDDLIWDAIKASCILAGARTLAGALVPLKGTAPTNFNFVSTDYNRKIGLSGNGTTKYLNSNRNNNADPQNSKHLSTWKTITSGTGALIGNNTNQTGASWLFDNFTANSDTIRINTSPAITALQFPTAGFIGASRANSTQFSYRFSSATTTVNSTSQTPSNENINVFRGVGSYISSVISFYSIGESIDLAALDSRISTLMSDFNSAIP